MVLVTTLVQMDRVSSVGWGRPNMQPVVEAGRGRDWETTVPTCPEGSEHLLSALCDGLV